MCRTSKKNGVSGTDSRSAAASPRLAARLAVSWNGRGRPSGRSAIASPSRISVRAGSARTASTISGMRSPMGSSVRVNTATSSPSRCTWTRTPSSFHSTAGRAIPSSAASSDGAVLASIGCTGRPTSSLKRGEPGSALRQRRLGHARKVAGEHRGAAHGRRLDAGGGCDGIGDDAGERALTQLAAGQHGQESLLLGGRAAEQRGDLLPPCGDGARPAQRLDPRERAIDLHDLEARRRSGGGQVAQGRPADAGAPLAQLAREVADDDRNLARPCSPQALGECRDLRQARARGRDGSRGGDEICEQHARIVLRGRVRRSRAARDPWCPGSGCARHAGPPARRRSCGRRRPGRRPPRGGCPPCAPSAPAWPA